MTFRTLLTLTTAASLLTVPAAFAASVPEGVTLAEEQTFTYRMLDQFPTLDPALIEETAGNHVARQLFEGLTVQDAQGNLLPGVATDWSSEDNVTWTFNLREDAKWSNGDPVTANDFVYAWKRAADPATASPYAWYIELSSIENAGGVVAGDVDPGELGVRAVDDYTLEVTLDKPLPFFPAIANYSTFFPVHQATVEEHGDDWTRPETIVSNGAYALEEVSLNELWSATKNPEYWDAENVVIETVTGYIINDVNQALTRWESDEYDMLEPLPAGAFPRLKEQYPEAAHSVPRLCSYYYTINQSDSGPEALKDPRVRTALSFAIDRGVIVDQILQGGQTEAYNFTHAQTAGFEMPEIGYANMTQEQRDEEAKRLWEEAGVEDLTLKLIYNTSESHKQIATVISQMWKQKLGVDISLENYEWSTYLEIRGNQNFDLARSAWCGDYNEASTFLDLLTSTSTSNDGKYANEEVDALMQESKLSDNPQEQYTQVEQILADEMAIIPIYHYANTFLLDPALKGFPMENVENNWYVKDFYRTAEE